MRVTIVGLLLGLVVPARLQQTGIRFDIHNEPLDYRDQTWMKFFLENRHKCHATLNYGATFYGGFNCTKETELPGMPFHDYGCEDLCQPLAPARSLFLEGLFWKDHKEHSPHRLLVMEPKQVELYKWRMHFAGIATQGPTVKLYSRSHCEAGGKDTFLGRAYIPEEQPFACINFHTPVHSMRLQHIKTCQRLHNDRLARPRPTIISLQDATPEIIRQAYPGVDWDAWEDKKLQEETTLEEEPAKPEQDANLSEEELKQAVSVFEKQFRDAGGDMSELEGLSTEQKFRKLIALRPGLANEKVQNSTVP